MASSAARALREAVHANLGRVRERLGAACATAKRDPSSVELVAVTKYGGPALIEALLEEGQRDLGESRAERIAALDAVLPGARPRWHMVGHLQTNKCRDAVGLFEMIQSVDSLRLAEELNRRAEQAAKTMPILLEVNAVGEASKFGCRPDQLLADLDRINALPRLEIQGLMTVPPWAIDPEKVRPVFRQMRELKARCEQLLGAPLPHLSMGMTGDFEVAIEEGATLVRIGTAVFGARPRAGA